MRSLRKNRMLKGVRISGFFKWKGEVRIKASGWTYAKSQAGKPDLRKADGSAICFCLWDFGVRIPPKKGQNSFVDA